MANTSIIHIPGFRFCGMNIGIKDQSLDFGAIVSDVPCQAAAVFTRNSMPGAPLIVGKEHIRDGKLQAIVVNSKNSNVATGAEGIEDSRQICRWAAEQLNLQESLVLPSSTGVIGRPLPMDKLRHGCENLTQLLGDTVAHAEQFARAIMTTDNVPKWASIQREGYRIMGFAKGAGMIEPDMATLLSYIITDAAIDAERLQPMFKRVVDRSYNRISIDMDTSTSDTAAILCNGKAGAVDEAAFEQDLLDLALQLCRDLVKDGEGAKKLVELTVSGAQSSEQAVLTGKAIINSPLVKTAIHGADPNWGRFVMAIGKVKGYQVAVEDLRITFGTGSGSLTIDAESARKGTLELKKLSELLKQEHIFIDVKIGDGAHAETVYGCELSEEYIAVNAYYTT